MKTIKLTLDSQNNSDTFNADGTLNSTSTNSRFKGLILESSVDMGYVNTQISVNFEKVPESEREVLKQYVEWLKTLYKNFNTALVEGLKTVQETL